ncbi:hypothetical protein [Peredibacter starrii]|uniref:YceI family protein n=1 Tax=Peredibacter starrii TaxID=28202 RepID=A0AAX4HNL5_9BACT|nr:hypothetical protein [Peredibacter starrii]WPU64756.1 hypothetical protein SOO65_18850 [Peredibacter starrii]
MKFLLLCSLFTTTLLAQTFVSNETKSDFKFQGTVIKEATQKKAVMTIRQSNGKQDLVLAMEVKDFEFKDSYQKEEFNDIYMESHLFPQIRVTGQLSESIDLTADGLYPVTFKGRFTMRKIPVEVEIPMKLEIKDKTMTVSFEKEVDLKAFQISYAGAGSAIGRTATFIFNGKLVRTH